MPSFLPLFGGANLPRAVQGIQQRLMPGKPTPEKQNSLQQQAQDAADKARQTLSESSKSMSQTSGMVLVCVEGAQIVCNMTIPGGVLNTLKVAHPRSRVEGKRLAQVQDVKRDTNIPAWPCKCKKRPKGPDYLPCDYKPSGMWKPGVQTETNDMSGPKNRSEAYKKGYETGSARGLETAQAIKQNPGVMKALQHGAANSNSSFLDLASFAAVESTGNPLAGPGKFKGLMQMGPDAAKSVGMSYGSMIGGSQAAMNNNVLGGARYMAYNRGIANTHMAQGKLPQGHPLGPSDFYMMHQQGATGYSNMIETISKNPNAPLTGAQLDQKVAGVDTQGGFKDYFDGKFDGARDRLKEAFPKQAGSSAAPGMMAIPQIATHRCALGGTIRIVNPGQKSKKAKMGGASMKP